MPEAIDGVIENERFDPANSVAVEHVDSVIEHMRATRDTFREKHSESSRREFIKKGVALGATIGIAAAIDQGEALGESDPPKSGSMSLKRTPANVLDYVTSLGRFETVRSLIDEAGRMQTGVDQQTFLFWKESLRKAPQTRDNYRHLAVLNIWVGEYELAVNENQIKAAHHFRAARDFTKDTDPLRGWASYDLGLAYFFNSEWDKAVESLQAVVHGEKGSRKTVGIDRRMAAKLLRLAGARKAENDTLARMGIPRPPSLDPICGAGGLAACLRALNLPHDKNRVLSRVRMTGRGSNLQDLLDACPKLGVVGVPLKIRSDEGLIKLPKPCVVHVERDHFVAVIGADKKGVTYLCTDCGRWPGGKVQVTWAQ